MNSMKHPRRVVDLTAAKERIIVAAKAIVDAPVGMSKIRLWPEFEAAVKELQALESDI